MNAKHTPGPMIVEIDKAWPFDIITKLHDGSDFRRHMMPCFSTSQKSASECMAGRHMGPDKQDAIEANARAVADEKLRAAAPDMLEALMEISKVESTGQASFDRIRLIASAAIAKAEGGAA